MSNPLQIFAIYLQLTLASLIGLGAILFVGIVVTVEQYSHGTRGGLVSCATPTNCFLLILIISIALYFIGEYFSLGSGGESAVASITRTCGLSIAECSYVWFNWLRSADVIRLNLSPKVMNVAKWVLNTTPVPCIVTISCLLMPDSIATTRATVYLTSIGFSAFLTLALDVLFATGFYRQIHNMRHRSMAVPPEYAVIASFGFAASILTLIGAVLLLPFIVFYVLYLQTGRLDFGAASLVSYCGCSVALFCMVAALLVMKLQLLRPGWFTGSRRGVKQSVGDYFGSAESKIVTRNEAAMGNDIKT
ncbi:hypothetical protein BC830DRAFT_1099295 [Chytriomyces sp. MP71]|nr:hypothetical protein BC830DRAFT_1099295 [Chytriomyces sp. MP71]